MSGRRKEKNADRAKDSRPEAKKGGSKQSQARNEQRKEWQAGNVESRPAGKEAGQPGIRNRVKELKWVKASELNENSKGFRTHPESQRMVLRALLDEVGVANAVIAYEKDGRLTLIDGQMRKEELPAEYMVPVLVLDVNEKEADHLLGSMDPLAALAGTSKEKLALYVREQGQRVKGMCDKNLDPLADLWSGLASAAKVTARDIPDPDGDVEGVDVAPAAPLSPSVVKQVQLILTQTSYPIFEAMILALAERYGKDNTTDAVFKALENQYRLSDKRTQMVYVAVGMEMLHEKIMEEVEKRSAEEKEKAVGKVSNGVKASR
jgi:hypothetical protein